MQNKTLAILNAKTDKIKTAYIYAYFIYMYYREIKHSNINLFVDD